MFFDCSEALRTDIVFDPACVVESGLLADTEVHQPFGEGCVALVDRFRDPAAFIGQCDMSLVIYQDQVVDPAHLRRDDLRRLPWGVAAGLLGAFIVHNGFPFELFVTGLFSLELFDAVQYHNARFDLCQ